MSENNRIGRNRDADILALEKLFREKDIPTKEDLQRVFTNEELTKLCLKHKCRVDMRRWNVVNDYREAFIEKGRYQRWSEKTKLRMLAYSVNYRKPDVLYDEALIAEIRKKEHEMQIKENILSLDFWERLRKEKLDEESIDSNTNLVQIPSTDASEDTYIQQLDDIDLSMGSTTDVEDVESQSHLVAPTASDHGLFQNINTESMSIDDTQSQMTDMLKSQPSEDILPHDYDNFDKDIPMTSTQSQKSEFQQL